jgi:hypothetical protein
MKVKLKKQEVVGMDRVFAQLNRIQDTKFSYFVVKNKKLIANEIEAINAARKFPEFVDTYDKDRIELVKQCAKKDADGNPIIEFDQYVVRDPAAFNVELEKLRIKHPEAAIFIKNKEEELKALLEEEIEFDFYTFDYEKLPATLNPIEVEVLFPIIVEEKK